MLALNTVPGRTWLSHTLQPKLLPCTEPSSSQGAGSSCRGGRRAAVRPYPRAFRNTLLAHTYARAPEPTCRQQASSRALEGKLEGNE